MYNDGEYEKIIDLLKDSNGRKIKVNLKIKNDEVVKFNIDFESLVDTYKDERFNKLELLGWGEQITVGDEDYSNKRIVLKNKHSVVLFCNITIVISLVIILLTSIFASFFNFVVPMLSLSIYTVIFFYLLKYVNKKIIIDNSTIYISNIFKKTRVVGNISDIASFSYNRGNIVVLNSKGEIMFTYLLPLLDARNDNLQFYEYLKKNYESILYICGNNISLFLYASTLFILSIESIFIYNESGIWPFFGVLILELFFVLLIINERIKKFKICDKKTILYRTIFFYKTINILELTKVKEKRKEDMENLRYQRFILSKDTKITPAFLKLE